MNTYCPYHKMNIEARDHFLVDTPSNVSVENRDYSPQSSMPKMTANGSLYGGPQSTAPWASIPVSPTATNFIYNLLRSANPPPGAIQQAIGSIRPGNNYMAMPELRWYNPNKPEHHGKYKMKGI